MLRDNIPNSGDGLPQRGRRVMHLDRPDGATTQIKMMYPTNPNRIRFKMNMPQLLAEKTTVAGIEIIQTQTTLIFRKTNSLPSNNGRRTTTGITSPKKISANANYLLEHNCRDRENVQPELDLPK
jgi:hypothetical protein